MTDRQETWITGIGLISSLGEGLDAHWEALEQGRVNVDDKTFAPWLVHPLAPVTFDAQIPKKSDQRQMEALQRIGTYAAGLALESAGIKGKADLLARTDMIVASGGGERDVGVDAAIMTEMVASGAPSGLVNERLMHNLRPTLFLAQLPNLLAGNISIVHGVTGSSRTFMGEEEAGINAVRIAFARIAAGQSDIALVGGAYNSERLDLMLLYECAAALRREFAPVWQRGPAGGFAPGSAGVFLVIESRRHAEARGARPFARLAGAVAGHARRAPQETLTGTFEAMWRELGPREADAAIVTTATGAEPATAGERRFLEAHADVPVRGLGTRFGNTMEAQFPLAVAIGALSLSRGALFAPGDASGVERAASQAPAQVVAVCAGHWRGEGMALIERAK
ncbi:MAG: beta-ketoacyl-ACP synthase [Xanthobacteraceae bacterium]|nr:MAG: beta-ketoacyl-ACP synthase [Xanthobacteraceae bacterium]